MLGLSVDTLVVRCCQLVGAPNAVALDDASRRDWLRGRADMPFRDPPRYAAWQHRDAVEGDEAWGVHYVISLGPDWSIRSARVTGSASSGPRGLTLEADGVGGWRINGEAAGDLNGCLDVDLEEAGAPAARDQRASCDLTGTRGHADDPCRVAARLAPREHESPAADPRPVRLSSWTRERVSRSPVPTAAATRVLSFRSESPPGRVRLCCISISPTLVLSRGSPLRSVCGCQARRARSPAWP